MLAVSQCWRAARDVSSRRGERLFAFLCVAVCGRLVDAWTVRVCGAEAALVLLSLHARDAVPVLQPLTSRRRRHVLPRHTPTFQRAQPVVPSALSMTARRCATRRTASTHSMPVSAFAQRKGRGQCAWSMLTSARRASRRRVRSAGAEAARSTGAHGDHAHGVLQAASWWQGSEPHRLAARAWWRRLVTQLFPCVDASTWCLRGSASRVPPLAARSRRRGSGCCIAARAAPAVEPKDGTVRCGRPGPASASRRARNVAFAWGDAAWAARAAHTHFHASVEHGLSAPDERAPGRA